MTNQPPRDQPARKDPMRSFRAIMAVTLILEVIVVALVLPVIAKLGSGVGSRDGFIVLGLLIALVLTIGLLRFRWSIGVIIALHVAMIATWLFQPALGAVGVVFSLVWAYLLWIRRAVQKRLEPSP